MTIHKIAGRSGDSSIPPPNDIVFGFSDTAQGNGTPPDDTSSDLHVAVELAPQFFPTMAPSGLPTVKLLYDSQTYIVPLTTDVNSFFIENTNGLPTQVSVDTAANLFGAEKAIILLNDLHNKAGIDGIFTAWNNVITSDAAILQTQYTESFLAGFSGVLIAGALSDGATLDSTLLGTYLSFALGALPTYNDLLLTSVMVNSASSLLSTADGVYRSSIASPSQPIDVATIRDVIDDTLLSLNVGNTAANSAQLIPGVNNGYWDDLGNILASFLGPVVSIGTETGSVINTVATELQKDLLTIEDKLGTGLEFITAIANQTNYESYLLSVIYQAITTADYVPLTSSGLEAAAELLKGSAYVIANQPSGAFAITGPNQPINETSGLVSFTIERADATQAALVYVSTVHDQGTDNPNDDYYYYGYKNVPLTFAAGQLSATIYLLVNDVHLYSGSESFRLIVQQNSNDLPTTYLATDTFTINNTDANPEGTFAITPASPTIYESQGAAYFTVTRSNASQKQTVYVSTVHDQGSDNPGGNYYYNGLLNQALTFGVGVTSLTVPLTIFDLGLQTGSETFRLIVQDSPADPTSIYLASDPFTISNNDSGRSYSLSPGNPVVSENGPPIIFTITRSGSTASAETVYVTTLANQGYGNSGGHWYHDLTDYAVTFAAGYSSATFSIAINDNGVTSGSEKFGVVVQDNASDPITQYVAGTAFTINNNDSGPQSLSGDLTGTIVVNNEATVSTVADLIFGAVLQNNSTIAVLPGGSIGSDANGNNTIDNNSGATFSITTPTIVSAETINNAGLLIASPGAGNTATVQGVVSFVNNSLTFTGTLANTGMIEVQSGTLEIYDGGHSNASGLAAASGTTLLFTGPDSDPFTISGGTYNIAGNTEIGDASRTGHVIFASGTTVNLDMPWAINGTVDMTAANLVGSFTDLSLDGFLYLGSNNVGISNLEMSGAVIQSTGTITLTGISTAGGNFEGTGEIINQSFYTTGTGGITLIGGKLFENEATLTLDISTISNSDGNAHNRFDNAAGATLNVHAGSSVAPAELDNEGQINISGEPNLFTTFGTNFYNTGTLDLLSGTLFLSGGGSSDASGIAVAPGATLSIGGTYTFAGGTYDAQGTTVIGNTLKFSASTVVDAALQNFGTMEIVGGTLTLEQAVTQSGEVLMDPGTVLALGAPASFNSTISGFVGNNVVDLLGTPVTFAQIDAGEHLIAMNGATTVAALSLFGVVPAAGAPLFVGGDGTGGSDIVSLALSASLGNGTVCFADGTQVSIAAGAISGAGVTVSGSNDAAFVDHGSVTVADNATTAILGDSNHVTLGTNDTVVLGAGDDVVLFTTALVSADRIDGGTGNDTIALNGDYSAGLKLDANTVVDVENFSFAAGHSYKITTDDATVASGQSLTVDGAALGTSDSLIFNGAAEADGHFVMNGGAGADTFYGGNGDDVLNGNGGDDTLNISVGGNDIANGGDGNDAINAGATLTASDHVDGGSGSDLLYLNGDYSAGLVLQATTMVNVERMSFAAGHSYAVTTDDGNIAAGQTLAVNGSSLGAGDVLTFDGSAETDGSLVLTGGAAADVLIGGQGNDQIVGNAGNDTIDLSRGGNDTVSAGDGDDAIVLGAAFTAQDQVDGGTGSDVVYLNGDYAAGVVFAATTMTNVEDITLAAGHSYSLTANDATVAPGGILTIDGSALGASNALIFDGSAETDGQFVIKGGLGADTLTGGSGADTIAGGGGIDTVNAGDGNDTIEFGAALSAADKIDGGAGSDTVVLSGDYSMGLTFQATTMINVETIVLSSGHSYVLATSDATVAVGQTLTIDGSALGTSDSLNFDGSAETNGKFVIFGGAGADVLAGGSGGDVVVAGGGDDTINLGATFTAADQIDGGAGHDTAILNGDYSAGLVFGAATLVNIETLTLVAGHSYDLTTNETTVAAGAMLTLDGASLGASDALIFDGSAETNGSFLVSGGAGADTLIGGSGGDTINGNAGNDTIDLSRGGNDSVQGGGGDDAIEFGATLTAADRIDGGDGNDVVYLNGDYSSALAFAASTMVNVEALVLAAGHAYDLATNDATVAAGQALTVDGSALGVGDSLMFDGSAETDGAFVLIGGAGADVLIGGAGNDIIGGNGGDDVLNLAAGGNDTAQAGDGNDMIEFGAALTAADRVDGGAGVDTVVLDGDYSAGVVFSATTMVNVENLVLSAGHVYSLTTDDATVAAGQMLKIDGSALGTGDSLFFTGSAEEDGWFYIIGGAGHDFLTGGAGNDIFDLSLGGADTARGGNGDDTFDMGGSFSADDRIDGGAGDDTVFLDGDYSSGIALHGRTLVGVENLVLASGHDYKLIAHKGMVAAGAVMSIDASALGSNDRLIFNGAAEKNGDFNIIGGAGNDVLTGGGGNDVFDLSEGGRDTVGGGAGDDLMILGASLGAGDKIDGGKGDDTVVLDGDYSAGFVFGRHTMTGVEELKLGAGFTYRITTGNGTVTSGQTLTIDASSLGSGNSLIFDGGGEKDGHFVILSGLGADILTGGKLSDTFVFGSAADSSSVLFDTIQRLDFGLDKFDISTSVIGIDAALTVGSLDSGSGFDSELRHDLKGHLGANEAMLFTASEGSLAGQTFLVVDLNGVAGYQAGQDLVICVTGEKGILSVADFI